MARILVIRFASLGDIAISIPPVLAFAEQYPNHELFYLSNKRFASLFETMPDNVHFIGADKNILKCFIKFCFFSHSFLLY